MSSIIISYNYRLEFPGDLKYDVTLYNSEILIYFSFYLIFEILLLWRCVLVKFSVILKK